MVTERETEFRPHPFVCLAAFGYDERLSSIESAIFAVPKITWKAGRKEHGNFGGNSGAGFHVEGSEPERSEAV
jgi:hypothetical protein